MSQFWFFSGRDFHGVSVFNVENNRNDGGACRSVMGPKSAWLREKRFVRRCRGRWRAFVRGPPSRKDSPRTTTEIMAPTNRPAAGGDNRLARYWAPKQHRRNALRTVESASCGSGKRTFERERTKLRERLERLGLDNAALKVCRCAEKGHRALAQDPL